MERRYGRWQMSGKAAVPGMVAGVVGAIVGIVGFVAGEPLFGVVAGVLALAAGVAGLTLAGRMDELATAQRLIEDELRGLRDRSVVGDDEPGRPEPDREPVAEPAQEPRPTTAEATPPATKGDDQPSDPDTGEALIDRHTGLFSESFFRVALDSRIAAARRHLRPVAMVLLDVVEGLPAEEPRPVEAELVAETVRATLREADTACRLANGYVAILLEDTPENGAIWTVERIRRQLVETRSGLTMWAGIACYPAHAFNPDEMIQAAEQALITAREWRQDRIEVAVAAE